MYSSSSSSSLICFYLACSILFLLFASSSSSSTERQSDDEDSFPSTNMVDCGPRLLMLAPCAPFVQGVLTSPTPTCCDNLLDIYNQQPNCLCSLLNDTTFMSFPINQTLALELPLLCKLSMNISSCPGLISLPGSSASSPQIPHSITNQNSSSIAGSPTVAVAPILNMGLGFTRNTGAKFERGELLLGVIALWLLSFLSLI